MVSIAATPLEVEVPPDPLPDPPDGPYFAALLRKDEREFVIVLEITLWDPPGP